MKNKKMFTLVELIIVIAIVAILSVAAFLVVTKWIDKSRDARRISDLGTIVRGVMLFKSEHGFVPTPSPTVNTGTIHTPDGIENFSYVGTFGKETVSQMDSIQKVPTDPMSENQEYTYGIYRNKKEFQVVVTLEGEEGSAYINKVLAGRERAKVDGNYKPRNVLLIGNIMKKIPSLLFISYEGVIDYDMGGDGVDYIVDGGKNLPYSLYGEVLSQDTQSESLARVIGNTDANFEGVNLEDPSTQNIVDGIRDNSGNEQEMKDDLEVAIGYEKEEGIGGGLTGFDNIDQLKDNIDDSLENYEYEQPSDDFGGTKENVEEIEESETVTDEPVVSCGSPSDFAGGNGTAGSPFLIQYDYQLDTIRCGLGKHYKLVNDISLENYKTTGESKYGASGWLPIGDGTTAFTGTFNGNGKKITNLEISRSGSDYVGLFGKTGEGSVVKNLTLESGNISGKDYVGALIGSAFGNVSNINLTLNGNVSGYSTVGGFIGDTEGDILGADVNIVGNVTGNGGVIGGLVSYSAGIITNVNLTIEGDIGHGDSTEVGGFIGRYSDSGSSSYISNSTLTITNGDIIGLDSVGGFAGVIEDTAGLGTYVSDVTVNIIGNISGGGYKIGGFVGENYIEVTNTSVNIEGDVVGVIDVGGFVGNNYYTIDNNKVKVTGNVYGYGSIGGFAGSTFDNISNSSSEVIGGLSASHTTSEEQIIGGFVGYMTGDLNIVGYSPIISNCYSVHDGSINGDIKGGFVGALTDPNATINNSYFHTSSSLSNYFSQNLGTITGSGWTDPDTDGKKDLSNSGFIGNAGWNSSTWGYNASINNGYPYLKAIEDTY